MPAKVVQDKVIQQIEDEVYFLFRREQAKLVASDRSGEFHATDWEKDCMRNVVYSKTGGERVGYMDAEQMSTFWQGHLVHLHTNLGGDLHEMGMAYNFVKDVVYKKNAEGKWDIPKEEFANTCIGTLDDLVEVRINGQMTIVDKKTYNFKGYELKKPYDHHVNQINIYRLLLKKTKNIDVKYGCNIYIDKQDGGAKPKVFAYELRPIEQTQAEMIAKSQLVNEWQKTGKLPPRFRNFLCDGYCPHSLRCAMEES